MDKISEILKRIDAEDFTDVQNDVYYNSNIRNY